MVLPSLSLEDCFIFPLDFNLPCFPLHIKGWKSRWWTHSLSPQSQLPSFSGGLHLLLQPFIDSLVFTERVQESAYVSLILLSSNESPGKWPGKKKGKVISKWVQSTSTPSTCWFYKILMPRWTEGTNCVLYLTAAGDFMLNRFFNIVWPSTVKRKTTFVPALHSGHDFCR